MTARPLEPAKILSGLSSARFSRLAITGFLITACDASERPPHLTATGFLDRELISEMEGGSYQVYVPRNLDHQEAWPLVVYLHGLGAEGSDGLRPTEGGIASAIRLNPEWFPALVLFPQVPADSNWDGEAADRVLLQVEATIAEYPVDPDRVYLAGSSMGGEGVYYLAARHPGQFAGLVVSCGSPFTPAWRLEDLNLTPLDRTPSAFDSVARALQGLLLRAFHGSEDAIVDTREVQATIEALKAAGADALLTVYPGLGHNACGKAFFEEELCRGSFPSGGPVDSRYPTAI